MRVHIKSKTMKLKLKTVNGDFDEPCPNAAADNAWANVIKRKRACHVDNFCKNMFLLFFWCLKNFTPANVRTNSLKI